MKTTDHAGNSTHHQTFRTEGFQDNVTKITHTRQLGQGFSQTFTTYQISERDFLILSEKRKKEAKELDSMFTEFREKLKRFLY